MHEHEHTSEEVISNLQYALVVLADTCQDLEEENDELAELNKRLSAAVPAKTNAKVLSESDVRSIRREAGRGLHTQREIAAMFGVNPATVSRIIRREYHGEVR